MQPTADFDAGRLARSLLRRSRQGALATLMTGSGDPYCSLVNVATHHDGSPIQLVAGFGRIVDLKPEQFLTDISDAGALLQSEQEAIEHINSDHRDTNSLYATKLLGAEAADWRCAGCDPDGLDLQAGGKTLRLDFPQRVTGPGELRKMLVQLADQARAKR